MPHACTSIADDLALQRVTFQLLHTCASLESRFPGWRHNNLPFGLDVALDGVGEAAHFPLYTWRCEGRLCAASVESGAGACRALLHGFTDFEDDCSRHFLLGEAPLADGGIVAAAEVLRAVAMRLLTDMRLATAGAVGGSLVGDSADAEFMNARWRPYEMQERLLDASGGMSPAILRAFAAVYDEAMERVEYDWDGEEFRGAEVVCNGARPRAGAKPDADLVRRLLRDSPLFASPGISRLDGARSVADATRILEAEEGAGQTTGGAGRAASARRRVRVDADLGVYLGEGDILDSSFVLAKRGSSHMLTRRLGVSSTATMRVGC